MTMHDLIRHQLHHSAFQVEKVMDGLPDANRKVTSSAMSPNETIVHLTECYLAFLAQSRGESHNWGTYTPVSSDTAELLKEWAAKRAEATAITCERSDLLEAAHDFIIAHDYYHVGQLALLRVQTEPEWNAYSIYDHA